MQRTLLILLTALLLHSAKAQYEQKDFVRYSVKDGLSDNYITCITQDALGYIWAGTDIGLNRFDGNSFSNFYRQSRSLALASSVVFDLKNIDRDEIAIIGNGGLQLVNCNDLSVVNYLVPDTIAFIQQRNKVVDAAKLANGSIAMLTVTGFYVFDRMGKLVLRHDVYGPADIGKKRIYYGRQIFVLNDKECLIYAEDKALAYYNAGTNSFRDIDPAEKEWMPFLNPPNPEDYWLVRSQLSGHEFIFIPFLQDSIIYYDHLSKKRISAALPVHPADEFNWQSRISMLNDSTLAINGGSFGFYLFHLNRQNNSIVFNGKKYMADYKVVRFFFDREKRLWLGTNQGLFRQQLDAPLINATRLAAAPGEIVTGGFNCTYRYGNKLYAARFSLHNGLVIIDPQTMQRQKTLNFFGGNNGWNEIYSIEQYHPDTLWLGTNGGLLWLDTKTNNYGKLLDEKRYPWSANFHALMSPLRNDGEAWMCNYLEGMLVRYNNRTRLFTVFTSQTKPALPFDRVKSIVFDAYGDVWFGGHSLARWNSRLQIFDTLITVYGGALKYNDDILTLSADEKGSLWLHNASNDLLEYKIKERRFVAYSSVDGLPSDEIETMSPEIDGQLWIGSNSHLTKFDLATKRSVSYDHHDGLPEYKPTGRRIYYYPPDDCIYICCNEYILKVPVKAPAARSTSSALLIGGVFVNNKLALPGAKDGLRLKYDENNLTLNFTVIDLESGSYQFAYKINNANEWTQLGQQRILNLGNLQPGKYTIHLKATGRSGEEKTTDFPFVIDPPFWKMPWFISCCIILLSAGIFYLYRLRIKHIRQKANLDKLLAQTEMKALHAQMNPHFIFNSLNSIREMILSNENKEASHYLGKFAQLIRMTLDQSGQTFISLRNTIDYLRRYIEMEKTRNAAFTYAIETDPLLDPDETILPPMLIQPFIENAIWHGVTANKKDIHITISFKKEKEQLVCVIDDNGMGIERSLQNKRQAVGELHKPVGITNIEQRINLLNQKYNLQSRIVITDKKNMGESGTLVTLHLPLQKNEN